MKYIFKFNFCYDIGNFITFLSNPVTNPSTVPAICEDIAPVQNSLRRRLVSMSCNQSRMMSLNGLGRIVCLLLRSSVIHGSGLINLFC